MLLWERLCGMCHHGYRKEPGRDTEESGTFCLKNISVKGTGLSEATCVDQTSQIVTH